MYKADSWGAMLMMLGKTNLTKLSRLPGGAPHPHKHTFPPPPPDSDRRACTMKSGHNCGLPTEPQRDFTDSTPHRLWSSWMCVVNDRLPFSSLASNGPRSCFTDWLHPDWGKQMKPIRSLCVGTVSSCATERIMLKGGRQLNWLLLSQKENDSINWIRMNSQVQRRVILVMMGRDDRFSSRLALDW